MQRLPPPPRTSSEPAKVITSPRSPASGSLTARNASASTMA